MVVLVVSMNVVSSLAPPGDLDPTVDSFWQDAQAHRNVRLILGKLVRVWYIAGTSSRLHYCLLITHITIRSHSLTLFTTVIRLNKI